VARLPILHESGADDGFTVTWWRGGASPEVWRTTFETSSDGVTWTPSGTGSRFSGGWELTNVSVQGSTDLVTWVGLLTNTLSAASFRFSDPQSAAHNARFYRLVVP
jgi:hypothetical protein